MNEAGGLGVRDPCTWNWTLIPPVPFQVAAVSDQSLLQGHIGILFCSFYRYLGNVGLFW